VRTLPLPAPLRVHTYADASAWHCPGLEHAKATELYRKAIEIRESIFGPDHPDVALFLFNLGVCYGKMSRLDLAKPCLYRALKIRKRVYGPNHQSTHVVRSWVQYFNWPEEEGDVV
jgi:tetratricopeptide (TPR) repeat protein